MSRIHSNSLSHIHTNTHFNSYIVCNCIVCVYIVYMFCLPLGKMALAKTAIKLMERCQVDDGFCSPARTVFRSRCQIFTRLVHAECANKNLLNFNHLQIFQPIPTILSNTGFYHNKSTNWVSGIWNMSIYSEIKEKERSNSSRIGPTRRGVHVN